MTEMQHSPQQIQALLKQQESSPKSATNILCGTTTTDHDASMQNLPRNTWHSTPAATELCRNE